METQRTLLKNSIITPDGTELVSRYRHDFVEYTDKNGQYYAIDGGNAYQRLLFDKEDFKINTVYFEDDIETKRESFEWGSYGVNGDEPKSYIKLKDMTTDHIEAIIRTQTQLSKTTIDLFKEELEFREKLDK